MRKPNPVDIHVGSRIRLQRNFLGMSQDKLAKALGLTFQQVQKYERGANRVGASRLYAISQILDVPVEFFFDDMSEQYDKKKRKDSSISAFFADINQPKLLTAMRKLSPEQLQALKHFLITLNPEKSKSA